jgi:hypothetical protein
MKNIVLLIVFLLSLSTQGQVIMNRVIDSKTQKGIPYASILFPETFTGTISDSLGYFELKNQLNRKKVIILCIGYRDTLIDVENLVKKPIQLTAKEYMLEDVTITGNLRKNRLLGCKEKNPVGITLKVSSNGGFRIYFPKKSDGMIKTVGIYVNETTSNKETKLHFRFLEPDSTYHQIGIDKLQTVKTIDLLHKGWNEIDLGSERLNFSSNGLIVYFFFTDLTEDQPICISCSSNEPDYTSVNSTDYRKDFPMIIGNKKYRPAIRMNIIE